MKKSNFLVTNRKQEVIYYGKCKDRIDKKKQRG